MKHYFYSVIPVVVFLLGITSCSIQNKDISDYTQYVNLFIGTGDHGHTFPGAIVPHGISGMPVQVIIIPTVRSMVFPTLI